MTNIQKTLAGAVGVVLTAVGIAGFFSSGTLFGFGVNTLHNIVHLLTGLVGLWAAFMMEGKNSRAYNKWLGVIYLLVTVLGFVAMNLMISLLNVNSADNYLHLLLGVVLAGVGFGVKD